MNIKSALEIVDEVKDAVAFWPSIAKECGVLDKQIKLIEGTHRLILNAN